MSVAESEEMDFADDDIMEIAAYGTQVASIKKEEELVVFIKEEASIEDNFNSATIPNCMGNVIDLLTCIPMVYTTRLDQMKTWEEIEKHTSNEATDMILVESKPQHKRIPNNIKPEPSNDISISSYIQLLSQIQQLNNIVKKETYLRNEKLMKMCKPLKIVLVDIESTKLTPPKILQDSINIEDDSSNEIEPALCSSDENEPLSKSCSSKTRNPKIKDESSSITVAIKDKKSQEADVYIIGTRTGLKNYYRADMDECKKLQKLHQSKKLIVLEYCCWVNRENRIKQFINIGWDMASVSNFLRKPHSCLPKPCSCCCIFGTPVQKVPSTDEFVKRLKERNNTKVNIPVSTCNIISKANNYIAKLHADTPEVVVEPTNYLKCAVIIIKYHRLIFTQTNVLGENYEIGDNGDITNCVRPIVNRSITEEKQLYQTNETNKNTIFLSYLICCWHQRQDVLTQLRDSNKLSPVALRFIKTPHLCRSDKCECCCKPAPLINFTFGNIATHNNPRTYSNKKQGKTLAPGDKDMKKKLTNTQNYTFRTPIRRNKKENKLTALRRMYSGANSKTSKKQGTIQENIDLTIDSCFNRNPIPTNSAPTNKQSQPNVSPIIDLCGEDENFADPTKPPPPFVTNILDRFKNMKLSVNENGKLTAIISTAPGNLTAVEIKVLSDILLLASKQIELLGITAQEFCNRVNASTAAGGSISSSITPMYLNDINKKANSKPACKTHQLKSAVPLTCNKTPVSNIYQMMSNASGKKNQLLVEAYKIHFKKNDDKNTSVKTRRAYNAIETPEIADVKSLADKESIKVKACKCILKAKLKNPQTVKPAPIKILGSGFENTVDKSILDKVNTPVVEAGHHWIPFLVNNSNVTPVLNNKATVPANQITPIFVTNNNVPIHNSSGIAQPIFAANSGVIPVENDPLRPTIEANNQTPFVITNSNFIPMQNISGTCVQQPIMAALNNQIPIYVPNSNVIPIQNTLGTDDPLNIKIETNNHGPFLVTNSNFMPVQNISATDIPQSEGANDNQIPIIVPNNIFMPMQNNNVTVQNEVTTDFVNPKMFSDNNKQLHFVTNVTQTPMTNGAVLSIPEMWADNRTPTGATPSGNPLLYQMLSKAAATPSTRLLPLPHPQTSIQPLIEEQRNATLTNKRKFTGNDFSANKKPVQVIETINCDEMDIETSLTTNVIEKVMAEELSQEDIFYAVDNKKMLDDDDDDEEDGIFGF